MVAVRVGHDGVALPPGRVPGPLAAVAEAGQLRVLLVDGGGVGEEEGEGDPVPAGGGGVAGVDLPDKLCGILGDAQAARGRRLDVGLSSAPSGVTSPSRR